MLEKYLNGTLNRRDLMRAGLGLGLAIPVAGTLLAACADDDDDEPAAPTDDESDDAEDTDDEDLDTDDETDDDSDDDDAPAEAGEELIIAQGTDINIIDPHRTATVSTDLSVASHLYTGLIIRGPELEIEPSLAESWEATDDNTWVFNLRDDVEFPNGEPLNAEAVQWNIERVVDPEFDSRIRGWFDPVTEVNAPDEYTVEIVTDEPYPTLPDQFSMFFLLAPEWTEENDPATDAMGTGPYNLVERVRDDRLVLEAKDDYWGEAPPFQRVIFRPVPEASGRVSGLLAGDYDIITAVPPDDFDRINDNEGTQAIGVASTRTKMVKFTATEEPLNDPLVRQALNYAVDKEVLIETFLPDMGVEPSKCQILTENYTGYNPNLEPYPYDPDRARELLEEAGYPDGFELDFDVPTGTYLRGEEIAQAVVGQLEQVGVRVQINEMPFSVFMDKYIEEQNPGQLQYLTWAWPTIDAGGILGLLQEDSAYSFYENDEFNRLLAEAQTTVDPDEREEIFHEITQLLCEEPPCIYLFPQPATFGMSSRVEWSGRGDDWIRAMDMRPGSGS
jgi:peptide/nickel transport system substrate-binding protein